MLQEKFPQVLALLRCFGGRKTLCYRWINSRAKSINEQKFALRFTPRTKNSGWCINTTELMQYMTRSCLGGGLGCITSHWCVRVTTIIIIHTYFFSVMLAHIVSMAVVPYRRFYIGVLLLLVSCFSFLFFCPRLQIMFSCVKVEFLK